MIQKTSFMADRLFAISSLFVLSLAVTCKATVYTVGDTAGWDISADLPSWAATKVFYVGDALSFQYSSSHTLNEVDREGYNGCNATNAILTSNNGNTTVPLTTTGDKYFICGTKTHCFGGMKLQINVKKSQTTAPAASPQSPEPPSTDKSNSLSPPISNGGRGPSFEPWLCTIGGALLWAIVLGV